MKISTSAFEDGGNIPSEFTCDGDDKSPEISITDVPSDAEVLTLIVDDPDAPGGVFDHWLIWNLPSDITKIPEDIPNDGTVQSLGNAVQGSNGFGDIGYRGPCPPRGPPHRYRFKLYALDSSLDLSPGSSKSEVETEMEGSVVSQDEIVGKYGR